jgi:hypothetical protein
MYEKYDDVIKDYANEKEVFRKLHKSFIENVNSTPYLSIHRNWIEENKWGYGDREFHWMWKLIVDQMPREFKFLEIGVFKGQTLSLISLIAQVQMKTCEAVGITPLDNSGDQYSNHPKTDYFTNIETVFNEFMIKTWSSTKLIRGYSNDDTVVAMSSAAGPYDIVLIDGCHDYPVVCSDINNYKKQVKSGGFLVIDDCNLFLDVPEDRWGGFPDVSRAVQDCLENDDDFELQFAITHNRVWRKK